MRVSVVTASYNYQDYIKETIESVLNQTISDWEMIIVDDGSTDKSVEVIKSYCAKDSRIKLYQHEGGINKGLPETVKLGIEKASTDWIIFLESDDTITPDYIEEKLKVIEKYPDVKFIFNDVKMFGDKKLIKWHNKHYFPIVNDIFSKVSFPARMTEYFKNINIVSTFSAVMLKKEILNNIKWTPLDKRLLDYYLWTQLAPNNDFYYLDKKLTNWRMSSKSYINGDVSLDFERSLFYFEIHKNLNSGETPKEYIKNIANEVEYFLKKYKKYRNASNILAVICCIEFVLIMILIWKNIW